MAAVQAQPESATTIEQPAASPIDAATSLLEQALSEPAEPEIEAEDAQESTTVEPPEHQEDTRSELEKSLDAKPEKKPERGSLQNQHAALTRRAKAVEAREAKLREREQEIESIGDLASHVAFIAKKSGRDPDAVWQDFVEMAQNKGRRPPEKELLHEVRQLRAEVAKGGKRPETTVETDTELEQEQPPEQPNESELKASWKTSVSEIATANSERWPGLAAYPTLMIGAAALDVVEQYFEKTGKVPDQESVLDYLEKQVAPKGAPAAKPTAAKPVSGVAKPKARTLTNADVSSVPDLRELSQEEREELALKELQRALSA